MLELRPYQNKSINEIDHWLCEGYTRILLNAPPGSGKTKTMLWFLRRAVDNGLRCLFVVRKRDLVFQASEVFSEEGFDHGIIMSGVRSDLSHMMQIASIDTIDKNIDHGYDIIVEDEAHESTSPGYVKFNDKQVNSIIIGPTGTPFSPLWRWQKCVTPIYGDEVRDLGNLLPEKIYIPKIIDMSGVKKSKGDYDETEAANRMMDAAIVGDAIEHWQKFAQNKPTLAFCHNLEHAELMTDAFNEAGIPSCFVHAKSSKLERRDAKAGLISGKYKAVFNVGIFGQGWDCPPVKCILSLRVTWSLILWLQQIARAARPFGDDEYFIIIDATGNTFRHGLPYDRREPNMTKEALKIPKNKDLMVINCEKCFVVYEKKIGQCPHCGHTPERKDREIKVVNGELVEYDMPKEKLKAIRKQVAIEDYYKAKSIMKIRGAPAPAEMARKQVMKNYPELYQEIESELK